MKGARSLVTILFTDIVGSTDRVIELGDIRWHKLLEEHNKRVRALLHRYGGEEVNTAGDGFIATFDRPDRAVVCAGAIQDAIKDLGLDIRTGLHMGLIEGTGSSIGGIAVHFAARVAAQGEANEVIVSRAVHDAIEGRGFMFEDLGARDLKGVPKERRLFRVTDLPQREVSLPSWIERHGRQAGISAAILMVLLGIAAMVATLGDRREAPHPISAATQAAPGIAVLPFTVRGDDVDVMRHGMVSLLSTGLDGAGGLRTIAPETVLARWREHVAGNEAPDLSTALEVARQADARYALIGSIVSTGSIIRAVAKVYDLSTSEQLGQSQVEGSPSDILTIVDRLGVDVLRVILEEREGIPKIEMANLITESPEALKAYLEGEVHLRHFDLQAARKAYTQAVELDSMFALAHSRLSRTYGWADPSNSVMVQMARRHRARAIKLLDRLPRRVALLVKAQRARDWNVVEELDALREAVQAYPDDPEVWYQLGETLLHVAGAMAPAEEVEDAFQNAVHLDPGNAEYRQHYTEFAWLFHADSQRAARRLQAFEREISDQSNRTIPFRLALSLAFGDSLVQSNVKERLWSADISTVNRINSILLHPQFRENLEISKLYFERAEDGEVYRAIWRLFNTSSFYGKFQQFIGQLDDPRISTGFRAAYLYNLKTLGVNVPDELMEEAFGSVEIEDNPNPFLISLVGVYAADRERWPRHLRAIDELEERANRALAETDSFGSWDSRRHANNARAYGLWIEEGPDAAVKIMDNPNLLGSNWLLWIWLGEIYQSLDRYTSAEGLYSTYHYPADWPISSHPLAQRELGKVYEALGETNRARSSYEYFVKYWDNADPELQPMVDEAREAIVRLGTSQQ